MTDKRVPSTLAAYGRRDGPVTPEAPTRFSYDHASRPEPATIGALLNAPSSPDRPLAFSDDELLPRLNPKPRDAGQGAAQVAARAKRSRRTHKPPSGGAFLLQDAVAGDDDYGHSRRLPRGSAHQKGKDAAEPLPGGSQGYGLGISTGSRNRPRVVSPDTSQEDLFVRKREGHSRRPNAAQQGPSVLDVDSTQIVNMALNLSESRRIASRRNITRTNPPRLAPVQDTPPASNIKTHLQQQRKTMRNISPKPPQALTPRMPSGRSSSPIRSPFVDAGNEGPYRYHFSTSTLARAQKAREHLELMAQYRQLLDILPPLKLGPNRPSASSPPSSPANDKLAKLGFSDPFHAAGREYNPLQYIRNRKVRARERMVIDGETQGFADVESVRRWVEKASHRANTLNVLSGDGDSVLPAYPTADQAQSQLSLESNPKAALRVRRPRVDWFFEPCDLVADAYWLEQDHHKQLIEDRNWFKIFSDGAVLSRPISRQADDDLGPGVSPFTTKTPDDGDAAQDVKDLKLIRPDTEVSQSSAKERAKQKLHSIGGTLHRHTASTHSHHGSHDFLRSRRDSTSDSGSDEDLKSEGKSRRTRGARSGTISSHTNDLLEKQMLEMIAQEAKQRLSHVPEVDSDYTQPDSSATPENSLISKRNSNRKWSLTDPSDSDHRSIQDKPQTESSPQHRTDKNDGTVRRHRNVSDDIDSPQPMSPELNPIQKTLSNPPAGLELSAPSSRASSPSRNPFKKVKKKVFRDKVRDEGAESQAEEADESDHRLSLQEPYAPGEIKLLPERNLSRTRSAHGRHKHHRTNSLRTRADDQIGLRGIFKGPRIDNVIRGGVSRLGDMLWKKDGTYETQPDAFSDESESEGIKGRARLSLNLSRTSSRRNNEPQDQTKHFLDAMPQFQPLAESYGRVASVEQKQGLENRPQSPQPRLPAKLLKLEVPNPTTSGVPSPVEEVVTAVEPLDVESCQESAPDSARAVDKNPKSGAIMVRFNEPDSFRTRKWSIADYAPPRECHFSKKEIARLRTLLLTSGIKAMEISRRAQEAKKPLADGSLLSPGKSPRSNIAGVPWGEIAKLTPKASLPADQEISFCDHYPLASQTLSIAIETEIERWQVSADRFNNETRPKLEERIWCVRSRIADDLSGMTGEGADLADETGKDLALGQLLKVKRVVDLIEELSRNRRRRFRWVRRGMWSAVEWALVGFMWYVWFIVTIFRIFLGIGHAGWSGIRWLLWL